MQKLNNHDHWAHKYMKISRIVYFHTKLQKSLIILILIILGAFIIRVYSAYFFPLDSDEDLYLSNARLMLHGWLPFSFTGANQSPLYYFLLAFFLKVGGVSIFVGRLLSVISATITAFFVYKIGEKLYGNKVGLFSSFIFAFSPFTIRYGYIAVTEPLAIMFISIAVYLLILGFEKSKYFFINGIFLALAVLVRRSVGFFIIFEPIIILLIYGIYSKYRKNIKSIFKNFFFVLLGFFVLILPALIFLILKTDIDIFNYFNPRKLAGAEQFRKMDFLIIILCKKALYLLLPALIFLAVGLKTFIHKKIKLYYEIFVALLGLCFLVLVFGVANTFAEINNFTLILFSYILIFFAIYLKSKQKINFKEKNHLNKSMLLIFSLFIPTILILNKSLITNDFLIIFLEISLKILIIFLLLSLLFWILIKLNFEFQFIKSSKTKKSIKKNNLPKSNVSLENNSLEIKKFFTIKFAKKENLVLIVSISLPILLLFNEIKNKDSLFQISLVILTFAIIISFRKFILKKFSKNFALFYIIFLSAIGIIILSFLLRNNPENNNFLSTLVLLSLFSISTFLLVLGIKLEQKVRFANLIIIFWFFAIFYFYLNYQFMPVYFSELAPVASIMCGAIIFSLYKKSQIKRLSNVFVSLLIFSAIISQSVYANDWYFSVKKNDVHPNVTTIRKVGKYIREHTTENEEICCYPIYAFEADRRVIFDIVYMVSYDKFQSDVFGNPGEYGYPSIEEIIDYMISTKLRYVVIDPMFEIYVLQSNPKFEYFIYSHYEFEKKIDNVQILILKLE